MTRQEVYALVALASSSYPAMQSRDPRPIVEAWALMLADMDPVVAKVAIVKICRQSQFFPSVADIVRAAAELDPRADPLPTAAEAWEEVARLIRSVGPYKAPGYSCDTVRRAARSIGWRQLCVSENPEADRAHFLKIYESLREQKLAQRENETVLKISGASDVMRQLAAKIAVS